jgi:hypothetical protein
VLLYDRPILDNLGKPRKACPVCGRFIIETDIDVVIVLELQEFWRGIVCDENKVYLTLGVCWAIFVIKKSPKEQVEAHGQQVSWLVYADNHWRHESSACLYAHPV